MSVDWEKKYHKLAGRMRDIQVDDLLQGDVIRHLEGRVPVVEDSIRKMRDALTEALVASGAVKKTVITNTTNGDMYVTLTLTVQGIKQ